MPQQARCRASHGYVHSTAVSTSHIVLTVIMIALSWDRYHEPAVTVLVLQ